MSYLDSFYRIHLEWMFENQPSLVIDLLHRNKLKKHLDDREQQALTLVMTLQESGMPSREAFAQARERIMGMGSDITITTLFHVIVRGNQR